MKRWVALLTLVAFLATGQGSFLLEPAQAEAPSLPEPGIRVSLSPAFSPAVLKGVQLDSKDPLKFHFFVDKADSQLSQQQLKDESSKLIKYFLASLTIPEKDLWVNLSPYEKDRIVPQEFGQTEMGRDLLAQDYLLKQITASLIYPEDKIGKEFWKKVYAKAQAQYGTTNIPVNTFNKVWIMPEKAVVYENGGTAFVLENHLKVMLEKDYLSLQKQERVNANKDVNQIGSQIVREIVIPELTREVNEGKNFAPLRQVFYSLILATWYKKKIKDSILNKVFTDKNKISGVNVSAEDKDIIYQEYLKAFKKGTFNYIKEEITPEGQAVPRKYFSGGVIGAPNIAYENKAQVTPAQLAEIAGSSIVQADADFAMADALTKDKKVNENEVKGDVNHGLNQLFGELHRKYGTRILDDKGIKDELALDARRVIVPGTYINLTDGSGPREIKDIDWQKRTAELMEWKDRPPLADVKNTVSLDDWRFQSYSLKAQRVLNSKGQECVVLYRSIFVEDVERFIELLSKRGQLWSPGFEDFKGNSSELFKGLKEHFKITPNDINKILGLHIGYFGGSYLYGNDKNYSPINSLTSSPWMTLMRLLNSQDRNLVVLKYKIPLANILDDRKPLEDPRYSNNLEFNHLSDNVGYVRTSNGIESEYASFRGFIPNEYLDAIAIKQRSLLKGEKKADADFAMNGVAGIEKIQSILSEARQKFPGTDYGWAKELRDPDSKFVPMNTSYRGMPFKVLKLQASHWKGFDCEASSLWLAQRLISQGFNANILPGSTKSFSRDFAVQLDNPRLYLSVTPLVRSIQGLGFENEEGEVFEPIKLDKAPSIGFYEVRKTQLEKEGRTIQGNLLPMSWQRLTDGRQLLIWAGMDMLGYGPMDLGVGITPREISFSVRADLIGTNDTRENASLTVDFNPLLFSSLKKEIKTVEQLNELIAGRKKIKGIHIDTTSAKVSTDAGKYLQKEMDLMVNLIQKTPDGWIESLLTNPDSRRIPESWWNKVYSNEAMRSNADFAMAENSDKARVDKDRLKRKPIKEIEFREIFNSNGEKIGYLNISREGIKIVEHFAVYCNYCVLYNYRTRVGAIFHIEGGDEKSKESIKEAFEEVFRILGGKDGFEAIVAVPVGGNETKREKIQKGIIESLGELSVHIQKVDLHQAWYLYEVFFDGEQKTFFTKKNGTEIERGWTFSETPGSVAQELEVSQDLKVPSLSLNPTAQAGRSEEDAAMKGGIDLNPAQMTLQVKGSGEEFKFQWNGQTFDSAKITGVTFSIRQIIPVTNLQVILGLKKEENTLEMI